MLRPRSSTARSVCGPGLVSPGRPTTASHRPPTSAGRREFADRARTMVNSEVARTALRRLEPPSISRSTPLPAFPRPAGSRDRPGRIDVVPGRLHSGLARLAVDATRPPRVRGCGVLPPTPRRVPRSRASSETRAMSPRPCRDRGPTGSGKSASPARSRTLADIIGHLAAASAVIPHGHSAATDATNHQAL